MMNSKYMSRIAAKMVSAQQEQDDSDEYEDQGSQSGYVEEGSEAAQEPFSEDDNGMDDFLADLSDGLGTGTEYSCRISIDLTVDFEGDSSKQDIVAAIKSHLKNSLQDGMQKAANQLQLSSVGVKVMPIKMDISALDEAEYEPLREQLGEEDGHSREDQYDAEGDQSGQDQESEG